MCNEAAADQNERAKFSTFSSHFADATVGRSFRATFFFLRFQNDVRCDLVFFFIVHFNFGHFYENFLPLFDKDLKML